MTESMKKALNKYNENVKQVSTRIDKQIYDIMLQYCKQKDMTKKEFIEKCILYFIDNNWYNRPIIKYKALYSRVNGIVV